MAQDRRPFRFVHTADLHLDSPLRSLAGRDERLAHAVGRATREALERIVTLCIDERVDALVIAGDLYDGRNSSRHTAAALSRALRRLAAADIETFLVLGNHDAESALTGALELPAGAHLLRGHLKRQASRCGGAMIHGISYAKPKAPDSLVERYAAAVPGVWNIGLMHTSLTGESGHHTYAPCRLDDLIVKGYDYWGLGHIHTRTVHNAHAPAVVMPGIPQGRHPNEAGAKSVTLVTLSETGTTLEEHRVASARFENVGVEIDGLSSLPEVSERLERAAQDARERHEETELVLRLILQGVTPLAARLPRECEFLLEELRQYAATVDGLWIDSLQLGTRVPDRGVAVDGSGMVERLSALSDDACLDTPAQAEQRLKLYKTMTRKLPRALQRHLERDGEPLERTLARLAREGCDELLDALREGD